jgi:chorismate mutase
MSATILDDPQSGVPDDGASASAGAAASPTGTAEPVADSHISGLRTRIDEIDAAIIALWQERAAISREVGATRVASGGTRLVLAREREIMDRFRAALGADGTQLALLILRAGRGRL